ncbi:MAG: sprT domain-containing protein [Bacteroidetes bacterium]|nr:sprT domain-containing protein [Bacteroidota bacterium]MBV6460925.1 hypothetical protein [Flavobacteriales bacterium]WKZ75677.1 MAG: sprT domain-containing protein [Vicingaceae bacterium]NOG94585.1 sprT domain-containing protein [Bacteroidota bacterium]CAG0950728.1 hypothetical protein FLAV_00182 [Flavobacteriales bacterium]
MRNAKKKIELIRDYLPEGCENLLLRWFREVEKDFELVISKERASKLGDFRPPYKRNELPVITVNNNLNHYSFLIILTHEFAHHTNWSKYGNSIKAHGKEWKNDFATLLGQLVLRGIFPEDIESALENQLQSPTATIYSDINLVRVLKKYDKGRKSLLLDDIPERSIFELNTGRFFRKGEKQRKRYKCLELKSRRLYYVSALAEVKLVNNSK